MFRSAERGGGEGADDASAAGQMPTPHLSQVSGSIVRPGTRELQFHPF
jgi:hypothetical protein